MDGDLAFFDHFDFYKDPSIEGWLPCPECGTTPKVWIYDNGRHACCRCCRKYSRYERAKEVSLPGIAQFVEMSGTFEGFGGEEELRNAWNKLIEEE